MQPAGRYTRRTVLRAGGGAVALGVLSPYARLVATAHAAPGLRGPGSLPDPTRPAGEPTAALPFDHIVIVMQENHSFDSYLGMLARRGQPLADGLKFDRAGRPVNANPVKGGRIRIEHAASQCTPDGGGSQSWNDTHRQINGGRMDGFARTGESSMTYWDESDLPFYYSVAKTFCLANRWFASAPCQTYPNRRFMLAGTAFGLISTDTSSIGENPPNGTIVDRLNAYGISWKDYFSDLPITGVIESIPRDNPTHLAPIAQFATDCAAGTLPGVSFVDSEIGAAPVATGFAPSPAQPALSPVSTQNQDEENGDLSLGENFVSSIVQPVLSSPLWPRILLVWLYDEHGGWYDHVPPPNAIPPDSIKPRTSPGDAPGGYDMYGVRVPAVVVSGYAKPSTVTNVVHDHTSLLATIQAKWNLPAMTYRDANAATMADFLDTRVRFPAPPALAAPHDLASSERDCDTSKPAYPVQSDPAAASGGAPSRRAARPRVLLWWRGRDRSGLRVDLAVSSGTLHDLRLELVHHGHLVARTTVLRLGRHRHGFPLHRAGARPIAPGAYELRVRQGRATLAVRRITLR